MDYQVDLETFRGPMDLLLYLVKREEVDICDIPIARIAEQFLDYLRVLQIVDVERAGEFLVTAATLMEIKSKMLLPRSDEDGDEEQDPRLELVRQLMEYKKFKDAAQLLEAQAERQLCRLARLPVETRSEPDEAHKPIQAVELWDLVSAFGRLMRETLALQPKQIVVDETPQHVYTEMILNRLQAEKQVAFSALFEPPRTRARLVGIFLALLELTRRFQIAAEQVEGFGEIVLRLHASAEPPAATTPPETTA